MVATEPNRRFICAQRHDARAVAESISRRASRRSKRSGGSSSITAASFGRNRSARSSPAATIASFVLARTHLQARRVEDGSSRPTSSCQAIARHMREAGMTGKAGAEEPADVRKETISIATRASQWTPLKISSSSGCTGVDDDYQAAARLGWAHSGDFRSSFADHARRASNTSTSSIGLSDTNSRSSFSPTARGPLASQRLGGHLGLRH